MIMLPVSNDRMESKYLDCKFFFGNQKFMKLLHGQYEMRSGVCLELKAQDAEVFSYGNDQSLRVHMFLGGFGL